MERDPQSLRERYLEVRNFSERLTEPLETEDYVVQSMPDASPTKWHLAHTTWFFDQFILQELRDRPPHDEQYNFLFNSYYNGAGDQYTRARRGMITRPTVEEVHEYRSAIDEKIREALDADPSPDLLMRLEVGLNHEQQHQELLLTDLKHLMWQNPLRPAPYEREHDSFGVDDGEQVGKMQWKGIEGGLLEIGHTRGQGFAYDNEEPRHEVLVPSFELATRPVTCGEYIEFMMDGGYEDPDFWLSEGWTAVQEGGWKAPLYWEQRDGRWHQYTLSGMRPVRRDEPVVHVSYYEADAFATWAKAKLPTEQQWEVVAQEYEVDGNFVESGRFHPTPVQAEPADFTKLFGDVWEWTSSAYSAYPGFEAWDGALGEYNGKFMCSQYVLRGGSCATSKTHIRPSYRNFFYPHSRWQFSGIRLAW